MVSLVEVGLYAEALVSFGLGVFVYRRGVNRLVATVLALIFAAWGLILAYSGLSVAQDVPGWAARSRPLLYAALTSLILLFTVVYPHGRRVGVRRWAFYAALVPVFAVGIGTIFDYYPPLGGPDGAAFVYFLATDLFSPLVMFLPPLWFLGVALRTADGPFRTQMAGAGTAMVFWVMNDGLTTVWYLAVEPVLLDGLPIMWHVWYASYALGIAAVVAVAASFAVQAARARRQWATAVMVLSWLLIAVGASRLQVIAPQQAGGLVHLLVDMTTFFILFYLVARHQLVDVALRRPSFATRGVAVAIGLAGLITAQLILEQTVGETFGWVGAILVGAAVAASLPLQQRLERTRAARGSGPAVYEAFRRMQVYQAAVEGALQDGVLDDGDNRTLVNLRSALGVSAADHDRLLADLVTRS